MAVDRSVVIVTGGGRGIGRAVADRLAKDGHHVVIIDNGCRVDGSTGEASVAADVAEELRERGFAASSVIVDVRDVPAVEELVGQTTSSLGPIFALVNAAAILRPDTLFSATDDSWQELFDVNVRGTVVTSRAVARRWRHDQATGGRIVNFTSAAGLEGIPHMVTYSTMKAAVIGFTFALANSLPEGFTANAVAPTGGTRMALRGLGTAALDHRETTGEWPDLSAVDPRHVGPLISYLLSEQAQQVTGRVFGNHGPDYRMFEAWPEARHCRASDDDTALQAITTGFADIGPAPSRWRVASFDALPEPDHFPINELDRRL